MREQTATADAAGHTVLRETKVIQARRAAELGRSGATRGRRWNCDIEMSPAVLPAVSYRDVRRWQRRGAKLPRQRILCRTLHVKEAVGGFPVSAWAAPPLGESFQATKPRGDVATTSIKVVGAQDGVARSIQVKRRKRRHQEQAKDAEEAWAKRQVVRSGGSELPRRRWRTTGEEARPKPPCCSTCGTW